MKKDNPLIPNKWFQAGSLVINLDWIAFIEFDSESDQAIVYVAAGKRKYKKIKLTDRDAVRLEEIFAALKEE